MAYADYQYYTTEYLGSAIAESAFDALALRASAFIDQITFDRASAIIDADTDPVTVARIKNAVCAVAEEMQSIQQSGGADGIASESLGNHSVTYTEDASQRLSNDAKLLRAAGMWLSPTSLLYSGFAVGEYAA